MLLSPFVREGLLALTVLLRPVPARLRAGAGAGGRRPRGGGEHRDDDEGRQTRFVDPCVAFGGGGRAVGGALGPCARGVPRQGKTDGAWYYELSDGAERVMAHLRRVNSDGWHAVSREHQDERAAEEEGGPGQAARVVVLHSLAGGRSDMSHKTRMDMAQIDR